MSLLLDALKEAENRHRRTPAPTPTSSGQVVPATDAPPDHVLALADDIAPLTQPVQAARGATDTTASVSTLTSLRAARNGRASGAAASRPESAAPESVPVRKRPSVLSLLILTLAALVLALGGAYWYLSAGSPITPMRPPPSPTVATASSAIVVSEAAVRAGLIVPNDDSGSPPDTASSVLPAATGIPPAPPERKVTAPKPVMPLATVAEPGGVATRRDKRPSPPPATAFPPTPTAGTLVIENRPSPLTQAHLALRAGDLPRAERLYGETLATQPDQADAHLGLALIEQARGGTAAAISHYHAVLNVIPAQPQAWAGLADLAGDAELDAMESQLRGLIATHPEASLHFALGNILARQSRWADAQQSFFAASTAAPQNADYAFNLAVALDRMGKGKVATGHYSRALALAADSRAVQFDTAAARLRLAELQSSAP